MVYRNTIANMMAEAEAWNGVFAGDAVTRDVVRRRASASCRTRSRGPGRRRRTTSTNALDLGEVEPLWRTPFSPGNATAASVLARERLTFDKALIGSCTNGSYDDLLQAALVVRAARERGAASAATELLVFPGSGGVARQIERSEPRLGGESIADVLRSVGAAIRQSWCGPCFGQGPDALSSGQRAITSFNRNWHNRMGVGGEGYLASPAVVAASALARLHGAAERARARVGRRRIRRLGDLGRADRPSCGAGDGCDVRSESCGFNCCHQKSGPVLSVYSPGRTS